MTTTSKYFVLPSTGANFIDFDLPYGTVSLQGQEIVFVGSTSVDAIFVRPGVVVDFTLSGASADKIYLSGNQVDYNATLTGSVMVLTRGSGDTLDTVRLIKSTNISASDKIIFADGTLSSFDLYANLKDGTALPALSGETSLAPDAPASPGSVLNANIKAFALDAGGETFAPAPHGIAFTVVGGVGIDTVYVPDGGTVDATLLGGNSDQIYFRGNWSDYSKTVAGSTVTFTRDIDGNSESVKVVAGSTVTLNDKLIFADGAVLSNNARLAINANANVAISAVTGFDAAIVTPLMPDTSDLDSTQPVITGTTFNDTVVTLNISEPVIASSLAGLSFSLNPSQLNGWQGSALDITSLTGLGTNTLSFMANANLTSIDVVRVFYDASQSDIEDISGNFLESGEIFFGGSGNNSIDLSTYLSRNGFPLSLRGNDGNDTLIGTNGKDLFVDGGGADTLVGGFGADIISLVENNSNRPYSRDVVKIGLGESIHSYLGVNTTATTRDYIAGSISSPAGTGFDISSATATNHDALDLPSNIIATDVIHGDGNNYGAIFKHSVTNGIVTFEDVNGIAILINSNDIDSAYLYLASNFSSAGVTVAFKMDTDNNGSVDSLVVFQDGGTIPLLGNLEMPDTSVLIQDLIGIDSVILDSSAGANVLQIQDTQAPLPTGFSPTDTGFSLNFSENVFASTSLALTMVKNGSDPMAIASVTGNNSSTLTIDSTITLTDTDWILINYTGSNTINGIRDSSNNVWSQIADPGYGGFAVGKDGNNTIDLSGESLDFDINGGAGNDTIMGSVGYNWIEGGPGADTMTGNGSAEYNFAQGDSPEVTNKDLGGDNVLSTGDSFSFADGIDSITDFASGETLGIYRPLSNFFGDAGSPSLMDNIPTNGEVIDQGFFAVKGNYASANFIVDTLDGEDTLIVYDGEASSEITQTGIVLLGVTPTELNLYISSNWISHI